MLQHNNLMLGSERRERSKHRQQATRRLTWSVLAILSASLQPHPFASDLGKSIAKLMPADADVLQLPVVALA